MQVSDDLTPLLNCDNLSKITIIDKDKNEVTLSTRELASKSNFEWTDDIWYSSFPHQTNQVPKPNETALPPLFITKVKHLAANPHAIKLKEMGAAGLGAITSKQIRKDDWICFYAGELEHNDTHNRASFAYSLRVFSTPDQTSLQSINATKKRNLGSFLQDLPTCEELEKNYLFKSRAPINQIATANVQIIYCTINNCPVAVFTAIRDVPANTLLGWSYGDEYWAGDIRRLLFSSQGKKIDEDLYISKKEFEKLSKQFQGKALDYIYIAFKVAASKGDIATVRFLINWTQYIQNINHINQQGKTALHYAAAGKHTGVVEYLLYKGADVNIADVEGNTPVHFAAKNNDMMSLAFLVNSGRAKQQPNKMQQLPIHYAIEHQNIEMLQILSVLCPYPNMLNLFDNETKEKFTGLMFRALSLQGRNEVIAEAKLRVNK